jgi:hypothetical protein
VIALSVDIDPTLEEAYRKAIRIDDQNVMLDIWEMNFDKEDGPIVRQTQDFSCLCDALSLIFSIIL